jgi:Protein of unknown function (DUF3551)
MKYASAFFILATAAFSAATPAQAIEYPWCAQYGGKGGGRNCGFTTIAQCRATITGMGGFCEPNLFYPDSIRKPVRRVHHSNG